ncbi:branched-chain amino acid ABC transporter permease [Clostridium cellulovorans]|uniref:Inner-membrane translocator n=1 Tax=Clostridium cellulovorans (strain ATCC 35296 / DSM 3052 / OCM 3 / 743B) TaxID=573061 RepID=D9SMA8_CLOC7|nr:branched-chain amino acid ABC transporter permease [Clostridium cellulovorans]ADL53764.1 inner-membrane translocator [Clostridium cellulovorans 743B]
MNIMSLDTFFQHLVNGISLGSLYALIAIGYTMVYGILRLINFAHGDIFMMGAYFAFYSIVVFSMPWYVAVIVAIAVTSVLGIVIERAAYKPLRNAPKTSILISAIGVSFLLESVATVAFGGTPKSFPQIALFTDNITIGSVTMQKLTVIIPVVTIILLVGLLYLVNRTKVGMAMRAVSRDYETSALMSINTNRIISLTFVIGSLLASVGGVMWGLKYTTLLPLMGLMPGIKCFIAAVIGGIGDIKGAVLGGFILGLTEVMLVAFAPGLTGYRDAFAFILLIVILLVKPEGIMGKNVAEKV